ncbi:G-protein gamma subunit [Cyathus striatus]|nr:G-protein gamma subunit [Cyathus striatus]
MSSRAGGRQNLSELKLRRILEHNQRLREDLARPRVKVSEASASLIRYCKATKDHLVCSVSVGPVGRAENPYEQQTEGKCCTIQ